MKKAFTMIELVFVIVILGILSAVALPKLMATRDDAKVSTISANIMTALSDIASHAMAFKLEDNLSKMSNVIKGYEQRGLAKIDTANVKVTIGVEVSGSVVDCVILSVVDAEGGNVKKIITSYVPAGSGGLCANLQTVIKEKVYPIRLEGKGVVY